MATFVLVHGAWHGAFCWYKVKARLEAAGHRVIAVDLPSHGTDRTPTAQASLPTYVDRVCAAIDSCDEPVVLVGHSMGGAVITQTAEERPERIRTLVYLAAFLLADGMSLSTEAAKDPQSIIPKVLVPQEDGSALVRPELVREAFYADCSDEDVTLSSLLLVPQALRVFATPVHTSAERFGRVDRVYVEATEDRAISLAAQRLMTSAQPCRAVYTLETSHSPFYSAPDRVTDILLEQV